MGHFADDKRWVSRRHLILPVKCHLSWREEFGVCWVRDFSSIGANLITNIPLLAGDELTLECAEDGLPHMTIAATVRWRQGSLFGVEFKHIPKHH